MAGLLMQMKNGLLGQGNNYPLVKDGVFSYQPLPDAQLILFNRDILSLPRPPKNIIADQWVDLSLVIDRGVHVNMNYIDRKHSSFGEMVQEAESRGMTVSELIKCLYRLGYSDKLTDEELEGATYTNVDANTLVTRYVFPKKEIYFLEDIGDSRNQTTILIFMDDAVEQINVIGDKQMAKQMLFSLRLN